VLAPCGREVASWPLEGDGHPDLGTIDELALVVLVVRRWGGSVRLRHAGAELVALLGLCGLSGQVLGQTEGREQGGVDEVVVPEDPAP
jgi:hypothetical protein